MSTRIFLVETRETSRPSRRSVALPSLLLSLVLVLILIGRAGAQQESPSARVRSVVSVGMVVSDMDRSIDFYSRVLTFEKVSDTEVFGDSYEHLEGLFGLRMRVVRMRIGDELIELTEFLTPIGRPIPLDSRSSDRWFQHVAIITTDMDKAYQTLRQNKVRHASTGPQLLPAYITNAAGIRAFYFRDPDNHVLEVLQFSEDKGGAKWHKPSQKLFLGIDHTAIVVADTDASLKFYRDTLGLLVAGEGENYGTEQEHLNNVFGARLRITSLRASEGPGIELLEYLTPRDGRSMPADSHDNDIWAWQTTLAALDIHSLSQVLQREKYFFVSPGIIDMQSAALGFDRGLLVRDSDGHLVRFIPALQIP